MHRVSGSDPESGLPVVVEMGWQEGTGYFFGIDLGERELAAGVNLELPELIDETRTYTPWTRQLYQAMRDMPARAYAEKFPGSPTAKILEQVMK